MHCDATALADAIGTGDLTASEAMKASLNKLLAFSSLGSVVYSDHEKGLQAADEFDKRFTCKSSRGNPSFANPSFGGVPTLAKDLGGPFKDFPQRYGSNVVHRSAEEKADSVLATRFRASGLCFFGLTTSPEFGLSLASEPACGAICRNPLNSDLSAGGSSGGAAAAVASGIVSIAHATDAGGSIRVPAACCGLIGLKPSRGAIPSGPDFCNHLGGIASELAVCRSVRDTMTILDAVTGDVRGPFATAESSGLSNGKLRIGLITETGAKYPTTPERIEAVEAAAKSLEADGHKIVPLDWAKISQMADDSAHVFVGIISTNLAELEKTSDWDFSKSEQMTQAAIERGRNISGIELWQLMNKMVLVSRDLWQLFESFDCLLTPMLATAPKPVGSFPTDHSDIDLHFDRIMAFSPLASLANISGFPAITLPFGTDADKLPLPVQILAPFGCEKLLLSLAARLETELRWQHQFPIAGLEQ